MRRTEPSPPCRVSDHSLPCRHTASLSRSPNKSPETQVGDGAVQSHFHTPFCSEAVVRGTPDSGPGHTGSPEPLCSEPIGAPQRALWDMSFPSRANDTPLQVGPARTKLALAMDGPVGGPAQRHAEGIPNNRAETTGNIGRQEPAHPPGVR